ncbi:hypothetical protein FRAAL5980 [Frankia alni ACN14a]|uniref:Uncharacterized protein n=1 Tax=Frankia alni (strain DSM 45986 / CECT 9034 / ACN14a) TaxID=326424 RepID=Q0RD68_FRAAA|nr:hypothetical protein FRAAL5980 [Frankia alni ACN14a]
MGPGAMMRAGDTQFNGWIAPGVPHAGSRTNDPHRVLAARPGRVTLRFRPGTRRPTRWTAGRRRPGTHRACDPTGRARPCPGCPERVA